MSVLRPARRPEATPDGFASPGGEQPPFRARTILADALVHVADVRCAPDPPRLGPEEVASTVEVVLPLSGTFVRQLDHAGRRRTIVGDPIALVATTLGESRRGGPGVQGRAVPDRVARSRRRTPARVAR